MIEVMVGVEIRRYATVRVMVEDEEDACSMAEDMVLEEHNDVSWNEPSIDYSEVLSATPVNPVEILADTLYEEMRALRLA